MKSKLILAISATFLFLTACNNESATSPAAEDSNDPKSEIDTPLNTDTSITAPQGFENTANYTSKLSSEVISADLKLLASTSAINIESGTNPEASNKIIRAARAIGSYAEIEECKEKSTITETGTKGSGQYSFEEELYTIDGRPATTCDETESYSMDFKNTGILEDGKLSSNVEMIGKLSVQSDSTKMTASSNTSATFVGEALDGNLDIKQWGSLNMIMKSVEYIFDLSIIMQSNMHFLEDKYRCTIDINESQTVDFFAVLNGEVEEPQKAKPTCNLMHNDSPVGSIEFVENGTIVYDLEGNEIIAE